MVMGGRVESVGVQREEEGGTEYFGAFKRIYDSCTGGSVNGNGQHVEMIERRGLSESGVSLNIKSG